MTFSQIQDRVVQFPEYVCFVPDERLATLIPHLDGAGAETAAGELLLRLWLYRGGCPRGLEEAADRLAPELLRFLREKVLPARAAAREEEVFSERRQALQQEGRKPCGAESFFTRRVKVFRRAVGIIPVVGTDQKDAFPIPFELRSDSHSERTVTDVRGNGIPAWEEATRSLWEIVGRHRVAIPLDLGCAGVALQFTGGSLALPVGLAVRYQGESGHDPLLVLATGAVVDGRLRQVAGCEAKGELARKMGARLWLVPGNEAEEDGADSPRRVNLAEEPLSTVLDRVHSLLQDEGLAGLDLPKALRLVVRIQGLAATGRLPTGELIRQAERCLEVFTRDNNPALQYEAVPETRILLAALENHAGRAHRAAELLEVVAASMADDPRIGLRLLPHRVVSFSDMGRFEDAEMWGRKALEWAEALPRNRAGLEARIQAAGSLGGDALLQKALCENNPALVQESRELLEKNREWAVELSSYYSAAEHQDDRNWAAMSASRVALWHAFFEPQNIVARVAEAGERISQALGQAPPRDSSGEYLRRTALLGDFRALISGVPVPLRPWELPSTGAPHWVQATALKYRAALFAAHGKMDAAADDFRRAHAVLRLNAAPILQTIAWSIAAQAVLSLPADGAEDFSRWLRENRQYVVDYLTGFAPSRGLAQVLDAGVWERKHLAEFQRGFAY